jgi:broad specificity phosphatase PhoE
MATSLLLLCAASTGSSRTGEFSSPQEPLDARGERDAAAFRLPSRFVGAIHASPWRSAMQTAAPLGEVMPEAAIADIDPGRWQSMPFDRIDADDPGALQAWIADPLAGAPGGEAMTDAQMRIGLWLDEVAGLDLAVCAVTHPMMIRAALAHAIGIPARATLAIDIAPLSGALLSFNRMWRLQALGAIES